MALSSQRNKTLLLGMWIFSCVVYGQSEAPTATLTSATNAGVERNTAQFVCKVTGTPTPNITWYKDNKRLGDSRRYFYVKYPIMNGNGELLRFLYLRPLRHQGNYSCRATNTMGSSTSKQAFLQVYRRRGASSNVPEGFPKVKRHPSRQVKYVGGTAVFNCTAEGDPEPAITWLRGYVPLNSSDPRYTSPSNGVLEIRDLKLEDTGNIQCIATNRLGWYYSRRTDLVVQVKNVPPVITNHPRPITINPDTDLSLYCTANGYPKPDISWRRDGKFIVEALSSYGETLFVPKVRTSGNYTCIASNDAGEVKSSAYVTVRPIPFPPTAPTASDETPDQATVTWQSGGGPAADNFTVYYRSKTAIEWNVLKGIKDRTVTLQGLKTYTTYHCRVFAVNGAGISRPSPLSEFTTAEKAPGGPPRNIRAWGVSDTSFGASWLPPLELNGRLEMYHLIYSTDLEKDYSQWRFKPEASNDTVVEGLKPFTTYYFRMVAYTRVGRGPPTEMFVVKTGKGAPGPAENVAVTVLSPTSIQVTWQPPHYRGSGIFGYKIHYNKSSSEMDTTIDVMDTVLGYVIRNLRPNRHYKVQVAVKSDVHIGPLSFAKVVQTLEAAPSAAPINIQGKALSSTSLLISWDPPPLDHRNGPITNYTVKYRIKGERASFVNVDGAKTSIRLHHLRKYTTYLLWVSASTSVGEGPMSEKHSYTTAEDVPSGAPRQPSARVVNSSAIVVRWSPPLQKDQAGRLEGYVVYYLKVDDLGNQLNPRPNLQIDHTARGDLAIVLTGLQPDQTYQIRVAALTRKGDGPQSNPVLAKTKPKLPNPPHVYNMPSSSPSEVIIRWKTVARDILSFKLRYAKSLRRMRAGDQANLKMKEMTFLPRTSNHIFKGLDPGVWYLFKVSTETKVGWSPERSLWVQIPPGPPSGPPLEVRASALSSTRVRVTWKEPDEWKRNGPLAGYSVVYNPLNRRVKALVKNVTNPNHTRTTLTDLKMFTDYEIRVRALGVKGPGPLSRSVVIKTKEGLPGPPRYLAAEARSTDSLTVSWNSPKFPNGRVLGYYVVYSDDQSLPVSQWSGTEPSGSSVKIKALERDKTYWIRVAARTSKGQGNYSLPVSAKTLRYDLPESVRELNVDSADSDKVTINWQPPETDAGITKYKISYSGSKSYKDQGELKKLSHRNNISVDALSPGVQSYTLRDLVPHTSYKIELSALNSMGEGPSIKMNVKTDKGKPPPLQRPVFVEDDLSDEFIPMELEIASERNGPISYYIVIVVPLGNSNKLPIDKTPDDFFNEVRRRRRRRELQSGAEAPYIAAKFGPSELPKRFNVGDKTFKNRYGYYNKELTKGSYYTMFERAYVKNNKGDDLYTSSPFVTPVKFGEQAGGGGNPAARKEPKPHTGGGFNLIFVIIPAVAAFVITAIVVFVVVYCRRKRRGNNKTTKNVDEEKSEPSDPVELKRMTFLTPGMKDHPPIPVADLQERIDELKADHNNKFSQEYESIEPGETFTSDASLQEYNRPKNRYSNILAFDHSRVHLATIDGIPGTDYINANFCDGYRKENAYIATQGPLDETIEDFWRMIWEFKTFTIVMLTDLEERGRVKCEQYWPNEGTELYGDIEVAVMDWVEFANYSITTLQVCKEGAPQPREVKHFQFTGWPDHGVPPHPTPFLAFLRRVRFYNPTDAGPIVVHCSGGVGRTACFIVIDSMLERVKHENTVDIYGHVTVLRTQRNFMVQTGEQYVFIHDALLEAVTCGNTEVHARNLLHHIKKLRERNEHGILGLAEEFRKLSNPHQARRLKQGTGSLPMNRSKNRLANILPYESTRVQLVSARGIEGSDYINASFIDGYRQRLAYIATQGPLEETVDDFWRMLMEHNSNIVVMLTQLYEGDRERCYKYWPTDRSAKHQYFIVDPVSEQEFPTFVIRDFKVKDAMNGTIRNIKQFHFFGWTDSGIANSGEGILDLIGHVQRACEQQDEEGPITVHCSDGVGRTGVFIALCIVLERMRSEGVVDLFQTVKLLRTQRPSMVQNQDQYLFCYQKALEYLSSFDHYAV